MSNHVIQSKQPFLIITMLLLVVMDECLNAAWYSLVLERMPCCHLPSRNGSIQCCSFHDEPVEQTEALERSRTTKDSFLCFVEHDSDESLWSTASETFKHIFCLRIQPTHVKV